MLDALERGDVAGHCEELGDLLMQIVFHAAIRAAEGAFDIDDVVATIADKLVRRHPHVFADAEGVDTAEGARPVGARSRRQRRPAGGDAAATACSRACRTGPGARARAEARQPRPARSASTGPTGRARSPRSSEEVGEVARGRAPATTARRCTHEIGDLLFAVVNLLASSASTPRTRSSMPPSVPARFEFVEDRLAERGKTPQTSNLDEMDALWNDAKERASSVSRPEKVTLF